jgi:uncharacterized repeat protein (TIGR03803 family)
MWNRILLTPRHLVLAFIALGTASVAHAQTFEFSTLYSFKNVPASPRIPEAEPIVDAEGNLYGTTPSGGSNHTFCNLGCGTVFKVTASGVLSVLHYFQAPPDGVNPQTSLFRDAAGNLYGSTVEGGAVGCGTIFKITPANVETVLYSFTCGADGSEPSSVVVDSSGDIYGTSQTASLAGLVFKLNASNTFSVLYSFCSAADCADGELPSGGLTRDKKGNLYGATAFGGAFQGGTLFKVTPTGVETVLHSFGGEPGDGAEPYYNLVHNATGTLYGVTVLGGANDPLDEGPGGTLFAISETDGAETILYSFCSVSECKDGYSPIGPVQMDKAGNLYGVTLASNVTKNDDQFPIVWEVNPAGEETILYSFSKSVDILTGLVIDANGNLYGTTFNGGSSKEGSVYKLTLQN